MRDPWSTTRAREHGIGVVEGVRVGHTTDRAGATGCTVVVCDADCVGGVDIRGGATATHETHLLDPTALVDRVHAIVLAGGSAPGLACVDGVTRRLREQGRGFKTAHGVVPITPGAAIFDLGIGDPDARPGAEDAARALDEATRDPVRGSVGAGTGATVGKIMGHDRAMRGGVGCAGWVCGDGLIVGAVSVVNAYGDIVDPESGRIVAGARDGGGGPLGTMRTLIDAPAPDVGFGTNTTLAVVATNAKLTKAQACIVARIAQSGIARGVNPCHTQFDGDMVFTLATGAIEADPSRVGVVAGAVVGASVLDAAVSASDFGGVPSAGTLGWGGV